MTRRGFLTTLAAAIPAAAAQEPTFTANVKVVNVLATVRDKSGAIVRDLRKDDFAIFEDGRPQTIRYFSQESDLPLTLGLLVDTSFSQRRVLEQERNAAARFLDDVLRVRTDRAVIVQFDQAVVIRQELTTSHKDLADTLGLLDLPTEQQAAEGSGTLLYDAVRTASIRVMQSEQGRKAFIVLTDGVDEGSAITLTDAIQAAQKADTLVYSILFSDASYYGRAGILASGGKRVLQRLSKETGGGFFEVTPKQTIGDIFDAIQAELRSEYSMGFVSNRPATTSAFRKLRVTAKQKGLIVQAREGYYAEP